MEKRTFQENDFLRAKRNFRSGEVVLDLGQVKAQENDPRRIQIDDKTFILPPSLIYHSCDPNTRIDWENMTLKALRQIATGEVVTYNYGTSEYEYRVGEFVCQCGSEFCVGHFRGFKHMSEEQRKRIAPDHLSPYIRRQSSRK